MASVRLDIEDAVSADELTIAPSRAVGVSRPRMWAILFAGVTLATAVTAIVITSLTSPEPGAIRRFAISLPANQELVTDRGGIALSADGKHFVYAAREDGTVRLYRRPMDQLEAFPLDGTENASGPFFSPDGKWVGFWADGTLKKKPTAGGKPMVLCEAGEFRGASWSSDDTIYYSDSSRIFRVSASGGIPEAVTAPDAEKGEHSHVWPKVLPDGETILFSVWYGGDEANVAVKPLETDEKRILIRGGSPQYVPTGHILFAQIGVQALFAVPFDIDRLEVTGSTVSVLEGAFRNSATGNVEYRLAGDGTLFYVPSATTSSLSTLVWVNRQGMVKPITETPRSYFPQPSLSPDDQYLAVNMAEGFLVRDIWILELGRGALSRLTFGGDSARPIWSHDGKRVYFASDRVDGIWQIFSKGADGSGEAEQLTKGAYRVPTSVSSDGQFLFFRQQSDDGSNWDIGVLRLDSGGEPEILLGTPFDEHMGMISPNSRWLAYVSNESGRDEIYLRPFPGPGGRVLVSTDGGTEPRWSPDGRELFYRLGDKMMAVSITAEPVLSIDTPKVLFEGNYQTGLSGSGTNTNYDIAQDGLRFVMIRPEETSAPTQLNVVLNWFEELKRVAPEE